MSEDLSLAVTSFVREAFRAGMDTQQIADTGAVKAWFPARNLNERELAVVRILHAAMDAEHLSKHSGKAA